LKQISRPEKTDMQDFTTARHAMVDSQIHTMGVVSEDILNAYRTVRREEFVPESRRGIAYCDEDMPVAQGRCLMEPVTHARLVQAAQPLTSETVLDIGGATGYSAAILSGLSRQVVALESDASLLAMAEAAWKKIGCLNIMPHQGGGAQGCAAHGPYNVIFINGSMAEIPPALIDQLAVGGRLLAVLRGAGDRIGRAVLVTKSVTGVTSERILFDAAVPYLPGHEPRNGFVF
jgi:protein-L-isoaspartate(D-aspartate) O-methyltransferase